MNSDKVNVEREAEETHEPLVPMPLGPVSQLTGGSSWGGGDCDNIVWGEI